MYFSGLLFRVLGELAATVVIAFRSRTSNLVVRLHRVAFVDPVISRATTRVTTFQFPVLLSLRP